MISLSFISPLFFAPVSLGGISSDFQSASRVKIVVLAALGCAIFFLPEKVRWAAPPTRLIRILNL
jgi:hypothetical protein